MIPIKLGNFLGHQTFLDWEILIIGVKVFDVSFEKVVFFGEMIVIGFRD